MASAWFLTLDQAATCSIIIFISIPHLLYRIAAVGFPCRSGFKSPLSLVSIELLSSAVVAIPCNRAHHASSCWFSNVQKGVGLITFAPYDNTKQAYEDLQNCLATNNVNIDYILYQTESSSPATADLTQLLTGLQTCAPTLNFPPVPSAIQDIKTDLHFKTRNYCSPD